MVAQVQLSVEKHALRLGLGGTVDMQDGNLEHLTPSGFWEVDGIEEVLLTIRNLSGATGYERISVELFHPFLKHSQIFFIKCIAPSEPR